MTTITIPIDVAEAAAEALGNFVSDHGWSDSDMQAMDNLDAYIARHKANQAARDKLAKPADIADEMSAVADQFAHRLALDLECVLADYQGTWYDTAINTLGAYRGAMNAIHERESPTFMGEPVLLDIAVPTPAWHDAPEVAALKAERDAQLATYDKAIDHLQSQVYELVAALKGVIRVADRKTEEFDAARAAIAKAEGRTE